jgi:hypothetical protein
MLPRRLHRAYLVKLALWGVGSVTASHGIAIQCAQSISAAPSQTHWMVAMRKTPAVKNHNIADRINTTFNDLERNGRITAEKAFELGKLLLEAKVQQQHGDWLIWLETNCPRLVRQAPIFINLYRHRAKLKVTADSSPFGLFRLLGSIDPDAPPGIGPST